ncbi:hypothetical protein [Nocardia huaxiensis]|uniref:Uncharacterized protein n=1 Tax=Nocardia huaxiensis TaxID=2755382 RepID=A0A7D6VJA1_9NOCA|nr:hypothetical protein [Nocardia huaxiensis]QLY30770.1 hypothetical protein H0264_37725 [Nocardia huaxiensis]UFS94265.1 hypothetical protein LPY97_26320 [Nocardia huaxiensis]
MIALLASFAVVAGFAAVVYLFAPKPGERWGILLERYRPHAPMSDWSVADYEVARQYSDLAAARAHQDAAAPVRSSAPVQRRAPRFPDLANIPCREETVQF